MILCHPMDCSPPDSSVHGILQVRILEWVAISLSRGTSDPGIEPRSLVSREILYHLSHKGRPKVKVLAAPSCSTL